MSYRTLSLKHQSPPRHESVQGRELKKKRKGSFPNPLQKTMMRACFDSRPLAMGSPHHSTIVRSALMFTIQYGLLLTLVAFFIVACSTPEESAKEETYEQCLVDGEATMSG